MIMKKITKVISSHMEVKMEIILILLTGTLMGALFLACAAIGFYAGMKVASKKAKKEDNSIEITEDNAKAFAGLFELLNYNGDIRNGGKQ